MRGASLLGSNERYSSPAPDVDAGPDIDAFELSEKPYDIEAIVNTVKHVPGIQKT